MSAGGDQCSSKLIIRPEQINTNKYLQESHPRRSWRLFSVRSDTPVTWRPRERSELARRNDAAQERPRRPRPALRPVSRGRSRWFELYHCNKTNFCNRARINSAPRRANPNQDRTGRREPSVILFTERHGTSRNVTERHGTSRNITGCHGTFSLSITDAFATCG